MSGDMGISISLRESLLQIAKTAHDSTLTIQEKSEKLAMLVEPTLVLLEEKISDVGGTRRKLLNEFRDMLHSGNWAVLPEPANVALTIDKINRISAAISDVKDRIAVDATELFRAVLEVMRKMMLENKFSQTTQHKLDINAAQVAKDQRKTANDKQLSSELASSIAQGIGGVISLAGAAVSVHSVKISTESSIKATKLASGIVDGKKVKKSLDRLEGAVDAAKNKLAKLDEDILSKRQELGKLESYGKFASPAEKKRLGALQQEVGKNGTLLSDRDLAATELKRAQTVYKKRANQVETLRKDSDTNLAMANALQSLTGSISGITNSIGGIISATQKNESATAQQNVDQQNINREVAQKMYQGASDSANSAREGLRSAMSMISAIEQAYASMTSLLARNSV